jgi:anti-sigma factor RsiW
MKGERVDHPVELLSASIDRELRPAEALALESHLEGCAECRGLLVDFRRLDGALADDPPPAVPTGLKERILAQVRPQTATAPIPFWRQAMPLAAAASVVMAVLLWYGRPNRLPPLSEVAPASALELPTAEAALPDTTLRSVTPSREAPAPADEAKEDAPAASPVLPTALPVAPSAPALAPAGGKPEKQVAVKGAEKPAPEVKEGAATGAWKVDQGAVAPKDQAVADAEKVSAEAEAAAESARKSARTPAAPDERSEADRLRVEARGAARAQAAPVPGIVARNVSEPAPMQPAAARPRPVGLFAAPYTVTLVADRLMQVSSGPYSCAVPIEESDSKILAAALEEILPLSDVASRPFAFEGTGAIAVTVSPQARESILRLVRERYRRVIEQRCGALPD